MTRIAAPNAMGLPPRLDRSTLAELEARARDGDEDARNAVLLDMHRMVLRVARSAARRARADHEDAAQDAALHLLEKFDAFEPEPTERVQKVASRVTFSYWCALRSVQNAMRRERTHRNRTAPLPYEDFAVDSDDEIDEPETAREAALRLALARLPERDALILRMRSGLGAGTSSLQEVAAVVGVTKERVRQIERKALHRLGKLLGAEIDPGRKLSLGYAAPQHGERPACSAPGCKSPFAGRHPFRPLTPFGLDGECCDTCYKFLCRLRDRGFPVIRRTAKRAAHDHALSRPDLFPLCAPPFNPLEP